jgi:hypothetical protein
MANPIMPRAQVHAWSESIGDEQTEHEAALNRLLKDQRRITRFIEENAESFEGAGGGVCTYLVGVICRIFDLAGGRLKSATWSQVREASARVQGAAGDLLPLDESFQERARGVSWRAQPHVLDEALMALFETAPDQDEEDLHRAEAFKVYLMLWVATEVLDQNWKPPKHFLADDTYAYVHIEPRRPIEKDAEATD